MGITIAYKEHWSLLASVCSHGVLYKSKDIIAFIRRARLGKILVNLDQILRYARQNSHI